MGLFYFELKIMNETHIPFIHRINLDFTKCILLLNKTSSNKLYYMVITNTWLLSDANGNFEVCNKYDLNIG